MNDTLKAAVSKAAEHRFPSEVSGVEMNPLATQGMRGAFTEGAQALYSLLTQSQGAFDEKEMLEAAPMLIGKRSSHGQDGEKWEPGEESLGWGYAPHDMKVFRKGAKWSHDRDQAKLALVSAENEKLRKGLECACKIAGLTVEQALGQGGEEEYDPTPYCSYCGAKKREHCNCGPIAEND